MVRLIGTIVAVLFFPRFSLLLPVPVVGMKPCAVSHKRKNAEEVHRSRTLCAILHAAITSWCVVIFS